MSTSNINYLLNDDKRLNNLSVPFGLILTNHNLEKSNNFTTSTNNNVLNEDIYTKLLNSATYTKNIHKKTKKYKIKKDKKQTKKTNKKK